MDIVGLQRKERLVLMGKVNAVDAALRLLGGGNAPRAKAKGSMSEKDRLRRSSDESESEKETVRQEVTTMSSSSSLFASFIDDFDA